MDLHRGHLWWHQGEQQEKDGGGLQADHRGGQPQGHGLKAVWWQSQRTLLSLKQTSSTQRLSKNQKELTLRAGERSEGLRGHHVDDRKRWGPPLADSDWSALCQTLHEEAAHLGRRPRKCASKSWRAHRSALVAEREKKVGAVEITSTKM